MVERYNAVGYDPGMTATHGGSWVRYSDYEALERQLAKAGATPSPTGEVVNPSDPLTIIAGIRQFGLAPDGADLRDLEAAYADLERQLAEARAEVERLKLDVRAGECLQDGSYKAGLQAGWNMGVYEDNERFAAAMKSTEHVAELKRIRGERAALAGKE